MRRTGVWLPFGNACFLRKISVYDAMDWTADFSSAQHVAPAPFGGPIALIDAGSPNVVYVYTAAGSAMYECIVPPDAGRVECVGWSQEESLVLVTSKPSVLMWNAARKAFSAFRLALHTEPPEQFVCRSGGVLVVANDCLACCIFQEKRDPVCSVTALSNVSEVLCADLLSAKLTEADEDIVYVCVQLRGKRRYTVLAVKPASDEVCDLDCDVPCRPRHVAVSPDGAHVALHLENSTTIVCTSDLSRIIRVIGLGVNGACRELLWCGASYLHLKYASSHFSGDPYDASHFSLLCNALQEQREVERIDWDMDGSGIAAVTTEVDGVRVVTEQANYLIEVAPECLVRIFAHGSTAPAALLCHASTDIANGSIEGITTIRKLADAGTLYEALDDVVDAAAAEFAPGAQQALLSVVALTKSQGRVKYDSDSFVDVTMRLNLLNNIRDATKCAIPLSLQQYRSLSGSSELRFLEPREAQVVVDRLVQRNDFHWAYKVATFMRMKIDRVLVQWTVAKVNSGADDETTHGDIVRVLSQSPGAGFSEAALEAAALGKQRLAIQLLNSEPRSHNQVMLLLQMQQDELAIEKAVSSDDADLMFLVVLKLSKHASELSFFATLNRFPSARMLFVAAARRSPTLCSSLRSYLHAAHCERDLALHLLCEKWSLPPVAVPTLIDPPAADSDAGDNSAAAPLPTHDAGTAASALSDCATLLQRAECAGDARALQQQQHLATLQDEICEITGSDEAKGQSVIATLRYCISEGMEEMTETLRTAFDVPVKKFWFAKLRALVDSYQWDELEKMGGVGRHKPVKSPIGFAPFVEYLHEAGEPERAVAFVQRLPTLVQRVEWYVKLDEFQKAVDDAFADENENMLRQIRRRAQNPSILQYIDERLAALK